MVEELKRKSSKHVHSLQIDKHRLTLLLEGGLFLFFGLSFTADVSKGTVFGTGKSGGRNRIDRVKKIS